MNPKSAKSIFILMSVSVLLATGNCQLILRADGVTDTYTQFNSAFGGTAVGVPDCVHPEEHITQITDPILKRPVFAFHVHVTPDNDRCINFDRQRTEVKTYAQSSDELLGFKVNYRDNFRQCGKVCITPFVLPFSGNESLYLGILS